MPFDLRHYGLCHYVTFAKFPFRLFEASKVYLYICCNSNIIFTYLKSELHKHSFIHADIKPDNIVLTNDRLVNLSQMDTEGKFITKVHTSQSICQFFWPTAPIANVSTSRDTDYWFWLCFCSEQSPPRNSLYRSISRTRGFTWSIYPLMLCSISELTGIDQV